MPWIFEHERIRALAAQSSERLAVHFLQTPIGIVEWNLSFQVIEWNPAAERIFGYRRNEIIGRHATLLFEEHEYVRMERSWKTLIATEQAEQTIRRNVAQDGHQVWCRWHSSPLRDNRGCVIGVLSLIEDVTSRRRIENSLHIHASAIRTALNPIAMFDAEGRITYVNNSFITQWGYENYKELIGSGMSGFLQGTESIAQVLGSPLDEGRWVGELLGIRRDGSKFDVQLSAHVARSREDMSLCLMASFLLIFP